MSQSAAVRPRSPIERLLATNAWLVFAFLYLPILVLIAFSFNENKNVAIWTGFSTHWYGEILRNDGMMRAIRVTLIVAVISTAVSTVIGTMAALAMERFRFRGRGVLDGLLYLPIIVPDVTMAVMLLLFFAQASRLLGQVQVFGIATITLSHIAFNISFVAVVVRARLSQLDGALEEAAADLYAGPWQTFRRVTLPLILPGVIGGALLALTLSLDDVVITQFVSGPGSTTLPVYVFGLVKRGVTPLINAVSTVMLVASMLLVGVSLVYQQTLVFQRNNARTD